DRAVGVERDPPQVGGPVLPGEQAGGAGPEHVGVERVGPGGPVDGDAPVVHRGVEGVAGGDEGRDVGDRVVDEVVVAVGLDVDGRVEVAGAGRVDRDERQVARVGQVRQGPCRGGLRLG